MSPDEYIPEPNPFHPNHPGGVHEVRDRERSRSYRYVYKYVVVLHERIDVAGVPSDLDGWHKLLNRVGQDFERAGMPEPRVTVDLEVENDYGDYKATGVLHFASMRDATDDEEASFKVWKIEQEQFTKARERAALEQRLRELR